jgi:hypothetical protein
MEKRKKIDFSKQGKQNRQKGQIFETRVREDLISMGWIVDKWMNTVDYNREGNIGKIVPAKRKYNPFMKAMVIGTGFPDFICFKRTPGAENPDSFEVIGVEVKSNGYLDQEEKGICLWLIENRIFSRILIARRKKIKNRIEIQYDDFKEKYGKKLLLNLESNPNKS